MATHRGAGSQILPLRVTAGAHIYSNTHIEPNRQPPANFAKRTCKIKSRLDSISMSSKLVGHFVGGHRSEAPKGWRRRSGTAYEVRVGNRNRTRNSRYYCCLRHTKPEPEEGSRKLKRSSHRGYRDGRDAKDAGKSAGICISGPVLD